MTLLAFVLLQASAPPPDFEAFAETSRAVCAVTAGPSNREQKAAAFEQTDCAREAMEVQLDQSLLPLRERDKKRFDALMREQATWNRFVDSGCALVEEMEWIDLETGEVTFGTAAGYAAAACQEQARLERTYFVAALQAGHTLRLVEHVRARAGEATETRRKLGSWRDGVARWITTTATTESELWHPLTRDDARRVRDATVSVEQQADALAAPLCRNWPALRDALGGQQPCARAAGAYLLHHLR